MLGARSLPSTTRAVSEKSIRIPRDLQGCRFTRVRSSVKGEGPGPRRATCSLAFLFSPSCLLAISCPLYAFVDPIRLPLPEMSCNSPKSSSFVSGSAGEVPPPSEAWAPSTLQEEDIQDLVERGLLPERRSRDGSAAMGRTSRRRTGRRQWSSGPSTKRASPCPRGLLSRAAFLLRS